MATKLNDFFQKTGNTELSKFENCGIEGAGGGRNCQEKRISKQNHVLSHSQVVHEISNAFATSPSIPRRCFFLFTPLNKAVFVWFSTQGLKNELCKRCTKRKSCKVSPKNKLTFFLKATSSSLLVKSKRRWNLFWKTSARVDKRSKKSWSTWIIQFFLAWSYKKNCAQNLFENSKHEEMSRSKELRSIHFTFWAQTFCNRCFQHWHRLTAAVERQREGKQETETRFGRLIRMRTKPSRITDWLYNPGLAIRTLDSEGCL